MATKPQGWGAASAAMRERATRRYRVVERLRGRLRDGAADDGAVQAAAAEAGVSSAAVRRWRDRVGETGGPEALIDHHRSGRPAKAWSGRGAEEAWALWQSDYCRLEAPGAAACYRRVEKLAAARGWTIPTSVQTFIRRLRAEADPAAVVRAREGRIAARATAPFQRRTTTGMRPLDVVNGDGWPLNIFAACPHTGRRIRPVLWAWQDVRTRRYLGWRLAVSESTEVVRLSMADVCRRHGVPRKVVVDNTLAASSPYLFGPSCYRRHGARRDGEAVLGVFEALGMTVGRTGIDRTAAGRAVGHGRAKPVERSFQDLDESICRHPRLAGAFTGASVAAKPENRGERTAPWQAVLEVTAEAVTEYNARDGRRMEGVDGISCDEAWRREIEDVPVRRLTREQAGMLLLAAESTVIGPDGAFALAAGGAVGVPRNRYAAEALLARRGQRVVARFDPADLHGAVEVYDLRGRWLVQAECVLPVGFTDSTAAKAYAREQRRRDRHIDRAAAALSDAAALAEAYAGPGAAEPEPEPMRKVVGMVPAAVETPAAGRRRRVEDQLARGLRRQLHDGD